MKKSISCSQQCLRMVQLESASLKKYIRSKTGSAGLVSNSSRFSSKAKFHKTEAGHSSFVSADKTMFIAVYVHDLLLFGADIDPRINDVMQNLRDRF